MRYRFYVLVIKLLLAIWYDILRIRDDAVNVDTDTALHRLSREFILDVERKVSDSDD